VPQHVSLSSADWTCPPARQQSQFAAKVQGAIAKFPATHLLRHNQNLHEVHWSGVDRGQVGHGDCFRAVAIIGDGL
jgi:hypothetical protein